MEPSPCCVLDGNQRWKGSVLAWRRDDAGGWIGLVRFTVWTPEGWRSTRCWPRAVRSPRNPTTTAQVSELTTTERPD